MDILDRLAQVLELRKSGDPRTSYVAGLHHKGLDSILAKVQEEAAELVSAARTGDGRQLVHETADLWFHTLVLLSHQGLGPDQVLRELDRRFGVSGLSEKAGRKQ